MLVNNAARAFGPKPAFEVSADEMRAVFDVNVFAVVDVIQAALPLPAAEAGRIVNVSSERRRWASAKARWPTRCARKRTTPRPKGAIAHRVAFLTQPTMAYSSSKSALNSITQHLAYQLERGGGRVRINAAAPGHCATAFDNRLPNPRRWSTAHRCSRTRRRPRTARAASSAIKARAPCNRPL